MIPANLQNPERVKVLIEYLTVELRDAQAARKPLEDLWQRWDRAYRCQPADPRTVDEYGNSLKNFPFEGAANLVLPVIATDVDTVFSRLMGIIFSPPNLWSCTATMPEMSDFAPRIQEFLQWAQDNEIKPYDAIADWMLELCKKGTAILKQRYAREYKKVFEWRELDQGAWQQQAMMMVKDAPQLSHVSLADFYVPSYSSNINDAPWCAERVMLTYDQFLERVAAGIYTGAAQFKDWWASDRGSEVEQNQMNLERNRPSYGKRFEFWEFWTDFDVDGDVHREAVIATLHIPSGTAVRLDFNPFFNQEKPYSAARYMRVEKRFLGIGLAEMGEQFQEEVSTMHNQRLDNSTLANSQMYKAKKGIGISENEPIYAGRIWLLPNPAEDLLPLNMGDKYQSTVADEQLTVSYSEKRTGVNDYTTGQSGAAQAYGTAYTTQQMLQAGSKRFDQVLREVRMALSESGVRVLELYQQFNQRGKEYVALGQADGQMVKTVLQFPLDLIRRGISISLTAVDANNSKDAQIRNNQMVMQQLMAYYQQYMQAMSYIVNPQIPDPIKQVAMEMIQGGSILMRRILDNMGIQDASKMIPDIDNALSVGIQNLQALEQLAAGAAGGGQPGTPGAAGQPGVPALPQNAPGAGMGAGGAMPGSPVMGAVPAAPWAATGRA